jgi:putative glutamine amidotransferase
MVEIRRAADGGIRRGQPSGFAVPMLIGIVGAAVIVILSLLRGLETKGGACLASGFALNDASDVARGSHHMRPIVGIPACARLVVNGQLRHDTPARYPAAVLGGAGAVPVMIPPMGEASLAVLDRLDGLLLPGSPSNVHPSHYAGGDSLTPEHHDLERDATTLRLIPEALARGMPLPAICRGIQELNVALGGTLHQNVHEVSDRMDHRPGPGTLEEKYGARHLVFLSGSLARMVGSTKILVNSLHGQAIDMLAPGLVAEAVAPDTQTPPRMGSPAGSV